MNEPLDLTNSGLAQIAEQINPSNPKEGYCQLLLTGIYFIMSNLIQAEPSGVNKFIDDERLQDSEAQTRCYSERVVQKLNTLFNEPIQYHTLLSKLTHQVGGKRGPNVSMCVGQTLFHICAKYKHYGLLQNLVKRLVERDAENQNHDQLLKQLLGLKNKLGQTVYSLLDMTDLSQDQDHKQLYQFVNQNKNDIPKSKVVNNDQQETESCKFIRRDTLTRIFESQLHHAAERQHVDEVTLYLSEGMNPNVCDRTNNVYRPDDSRRHKPLHYWVESSEIKPNEEILTTLLRFGADIEAINALGHTALQAALESYGANNQFFIPLLIKHGAHIKNSNDLINLLLFQDNTRMQIKLPLRQIDIVDKASFNDTRRTSDTITKAFMAIIEAKSNSIDEPIVLDLSEVIENATSDTRNVEDLNKTAVQTAIQGDNKKANDDIPDIKDETEKGDHVEKDKADIVIHVKPPLYVEEDVNNDLKIAFETHDYYTFLKQDIFSKIQSEGTSDSYNLKTKKAILDSLEDLNKVLNDKLGQANTNTITDEFLEGINNSLIDKIENDIINRNDIKDQHWFIALLKAVVGALAAFFTAFAPLYTKDSRERFTAKFFKSRACYKFTLLKQDLKNSDKLQPASGEVLSRSQLSWLRSGVTAF